MKQPALPHVAPETLWQALGIRFAEGDGGASPAGTAPATGSEPTEPKPTETVDFWKAQARENEKRAKDNAQKAKDYDAYVESQKSEQQKLADQVAASQREAETARSDALRYRIAAEHGIKGDDLDLLGTGSEEQLTARAKRIAELSTKPTGNPTPRPDPSVGPRADPKGLGSRGAAEAARRFALKTATPTT